MKGSYTALVTPFVEDRVNEACLARLIQEQLAKGIDGIVLLGTTGEAPTLTREEQEAMIRLAVEEIQGRVPLIVGTGTYSTKQTILNTKRAQDLGADMALIVTPYYNRPTQEGIFRHFSEISKAVSLPIIVYNVASRTGRNIEPQTMLRISELPTVIALKEASGSVEQMGEMIEVLRDGFPVLSGDDILTYPLLALGGHGVISVASNLFPEAVGSMVRAALQGDFELARKTHFSFLPFFRGIFLETNPIPIKEAMNFCGYEVGGYRLPLCEMSDANKGKLHAILREVMALC